MKEIRVLLPRGFNDQGMGKLGHISGSTCDLIEEDLEPADVVACVKGGADVYVNPGQ